MSRSLVNTQENQIAKVIKKKEAIQTKQGLIVIKDASTVIDYPLGTLSL